METRMRDLPFDPAALQGLSEALLRSHHQNNYGGAVRRLNAIRQQLAEVHFDSAPGYLLNGLKREELIATNSMLLHELYFDSLATQHVAMNPAMELALAASFGSVSRWREEFIAMGKALSGGSGWVLLVFQPRDGTLVNQWAADHSQALAGGVPILALDMYEHAYHLDFGAAASRYVETFMDHIQWPAVYERYQNAVQGATEALGANAIELANDMAAAQWVDVRRAGVYQQASTQIPGASWHDPAAINVWAKTLNPARPVVVYCVYGHEVGRSTALRLHAAGLQARFLRGGFDGWQTAGHATVAKGVAA